MRALMNFKRVPKSSPIRVAAGILVVTVALQHGRVIAQAGAQQNATVPAGGQPLPPQITRIFQQQLLQNLEAKKGKITGKKAANGFFIDPNGNLISPNVVTGLILTRDTFVADLEAWIGQLDGIKSLPLNQKRELVRRLMASFATNFDTYAPAVLNEEYKKFVQAAANANDVYGRGKNAYQNSMKIAEELERLERERPGTVATRSGMTAAQWRESAMKSPYGWFVQMRQRFYGLLEKNKMLALSKDGKFLFQALMEMPSGATLQNYLDLLNDFLDAGKQNAQEQRDKAVATNSIGDLLQYGGPKYSAQHAKAAAVGKALGAQLPQLIVSETTAVFEGISITTAENEEWWNTLKDLGLNTLAAGSILIPVAGPLIAAGVAVIQITREGDDLVVAYLTAEEARKSAVVTGYQYVITAEDKAAAAKDKLFVTVLTSAADLIGLGEIKNIKFVKGAKTVAAAEEAAALAAKSAAASDAALTGLTKDAAAGLQKARELGLSGTDVVVGTIKNAEASPLGPLAALGAEMKLDNIGNIDKAIAAAKAAGVPAEKIDAILAQAQKLKTVDAYANVPQQLAMAQFQHEGNKIFTNAMSLEQARVNFAGTGIPVAQTEFLNDLLSLKTQVTLAAREGKVPQLTADQLQLLHNHVAPNGDQILKWYSYNGQTLDVERIFDQRFLEDLRTVLETSAANGSQGAKELLAKLDWSGFQVPPAPQAASSMPAPGPAAGQQLPILPKTGEPPKYGAGSGAAPTTGELTLNPTSGNAVNPATGAKAEADAAARAAGRGPNGALILNDLKPEMVSALTAEELSRISTDAFNNLPDGPLKQALGQAIVKQSALNAQLRQAALASLKRIEQAAATSAMIAGNLAANGLEKVNESSTPAGNTTVEQAAHAAFGRQFGPNVPTETIINADGSVTVKSKDGKKVATAHKGVSDITGAEEYVTETYAAPEADAPDGSAPNETFHKAELDLRDYMTDRMKVEDFHDWTATFDEKNNTITYTHKDGRSVTARVQPDGSISNIKQSGPANTVTPSATPANTGANAPGNAPENAVGGANAAAPIRPGDYTSMDAVVRETLQASGINTNGWTYKANGQNTFTYTSADGKTSVDARYVDGQMIVGQPYATPVPANAAGAANAAVNNAAPAGNIKPADFTAMDYSVREQLRASGISPDGWTYKANGQNTFTYTSADGKTNVDAAYVNGRMIVGPSYVTPGPAGANAVGGANVGGKKEMSAADAARAKDLCDSAAFWRSEAVKAKGYAAAASTPQEKARWEEEAKWDEANARRREEYAKSITGEDCTPPTDGGAPAGGAAPTEEIDLGKDAGAGNNGGTATGLGGSKPNGKVQLIIITAEDGKVTVEVKSAANEKPRDGQSHGVMARMAIPLRWFGRFARTGAANASIQATPTATAAKWLVPGALVEFAPAQRGNSAAPAVSIVATGASTGEVFEMQVASPAGKRVRVNAPEGLVLEAVQPGSTTNVRPPTSAAQVVRQAVEGYCLEFLKPPPSQGTLYRVAAPDVQRKFSPMRNLLQSATTMGKAGLLHPDSNPKSYLQFIKQYALWTRLENWDLKKFGESFVERTKANIKALGQTWTSEIEKQVVAAIPGRWADIQRVLQEASALQAAQ